MSNEWVKTKGYEREKDPAYPGVWRLRQGGFLIRGRVKSDKTRRRFQEFAFSVFEDRVMGGEIRSAATRRHWGSILQSLLVPHPEGFGDVFVDAITFEDIAAWRKRQAALMRPSPCRACSGEGKRTQRGTLSPCGWCSGKGTRAYNPRTLNQAIAKLRTLLKEAHVQRLIAEDLSAHLKPFPTDTYKTYTEEQPNSLSPEEAASFLGAMWKRFPQWYALTVLGMSTGRRPSELRPLRKGGKTPDQTERRKPDPHEGEQIRTCLHNQHCELADLPDLTVLPEEAERRLRCAMADVVEATRLCRLAMPEAWRP